MFLIKFDENIEERQHKLVVEFLEGQVCHLFFACYFHKLNLPFHSFSIHVCLKRSYDALKSLREPGGDVPASSVRLVYLKHFLSDGFKIKSRVYALIMHAFHNLLLLFSPPYDYT